MSTRLHRNFHYILATLLLTVCGSQKSEAAEPSTNEKLIFYPLVGGATGFVVGGYIGTQFEAPRTGVFSTDNHMIAGAMVGTTVGLTIGVIAAKPWNTEPGPNWNPDVRTRHDIAVGCGAISGGLLGGYLMKKPGDGLGSLDNLYRIPVGASIGAALAGYAVHKYISLPVVLFYF